MLLWSGLFPSEVKEKFEEIVKHNGGKVHLLEGYGLTEAVTAIMAMPFEYYREGALVSLFRT